MNLLRARSTRIACVCLLAGSPALGQTVRVLGDSGWAGQRIVMLKGMSEVHSPLDSTHVASAVGINLVTAVVRVEGHRLLVVSTGGRGPCGVCRAGPAPPPLAAALLSTCSS